MSWIDWMIVAFAVVSLRMISLSTRKYMKGVADFLSASRLAGRYLLTIASAMGAAGAISFVAWFEAYHDRGFSPLWWAFMSIPVSVVILLTGWVFYRFRETRAMTLAQYFEMRYSRRFRIFAGFVCWSSGMLNFGLFPAVTALFFIYFCGLPLYLHIPGIPFGISTFALVMALNLVLALTFVTMGGQVSVMVTECVQGIVSNIAFVIIIATVLLQVSWSQIVGALNTAPPNASMLHPFHTSQVSDFNFWFFMIGLFGSFYGYMSWQGTQGFFSSARSPHEQKMGGIIGAWRGLPQILLTIILPVVAFAVMHLPEFSAKAVLVNSTLKTIDNAAVQHQMRVPIILAHLLPIGVKGLFATVMLFFSFTCHDTYMHSWGSIFIQDVIMPLRKKPITPEQHIRWLRWSIVGVAVFAFLFSLIYKQSEKIIMFQAITGTIWLGGSGAVIIGGLYWRRGTTAAAYCALVLGAIMGVGGLIYPRIYERQFGQPFPVNGQWLWFIAMLCTGLLYVVISLLTSRVGRRFDLERMLHRDKNSKLTARRVGESKWIMIVGITSEFSLTDRLLAISVIVWNFGWFAFFIVTTIINLAFPVGTKWWAEFWHIYVVSNFILSLPIVIWFSVGGYMDIRALYRDLAVAIRDHTDNGRVAPEHSEEEAVPAGDPTSEAGREKALTDSPTSHHES